MQWVLIVGIDLYVGLQIDLLCGFIIRRVPKHFKTIVNHTRQSVSQSV